MKTFHPFPENNLHLLRILFNHVPQKCVAEYVGVSQSFYCKLETGIKPVSERVIRRLNLFYKINVTEIIYLPKEDVVRRLTCDINLHDLTLYQKVQVEKNRLQFILTDNAS